MTEAGNKNWRDFLIWGMPALVLVLTDVSAYLLSQESFAWRQVIGIILRSLAVGSSAAVAAALRGKRSKDNPEPPLEFERVGYDAVKVKATNIDGEKVETVVKAKPMASSGSDD